MYNQKNIIERTKKRRHLCPMSASYGNRMNQERKCYWVYRCRVGFDRTGTQRPPHQRQLPVIRGTARWRGLRTPRMLGNNQNFLSMSWGRWSHRLTISATSRRPTALQLLKWYPSDNTLTEHHGKWHFGSDSAWGVVVPSHINFINITCYCSRQLSLE